MTSKAERFWITFIVRIAIGGFFLIVAIGQFNYGGANDVGYRAFADKLATGFKDTWVDDILPDVPVYKLGKDPEDPDKLVPVRNAKNEKVVDEYRDPTYYFLLALPFIFCILSVPILLGLFLRPALRLAAILMVLLGLGNYIIKAPDVTMTMQDFFLAFLICVALFFLGQTRHKSEIVREEMYAEG